MKTKSYEKALVKWGLTRRELSSMVKKSPSIKGLKLMAVTPEHPYAVAEMYCTNIGSFSVEEDLIAPLCAAFLLSEHFEWKITQNCMVFKFGMQVYEKKEK